jgi:RNA recognition motif-containing protein
VIFIYFQSFCAIVDIAYLRTEVRFLPLLRREVFFLPLNKELVMSTKLFVGNLTRATKKEDVSALFAKVGQVASIEMLTVQKTGDPNCFAFVDMSSAGEAEKAVSTLNGIHLNSRQIRVKIALPREKRPNTGGWYNDPPPPKNRKTKKTGRRPLKRG